MSELISWSCNLCATAHETTIESLDREVKSCSNCGSTGRDRQLAHLLSDALFNSSLAISEMPIRKDIRGLGLSDSQRLATRLQERFDYQNTFYDQEPRLDISCVPEDLAGLFDFVISSDVFEHVAPPVSHAFLGARRLLKPGGHLLLTVPWGTCEATMEHFPNLYDYRIEQENREYVLFNRTLDGREEVHRNLVFHGGQGATLEMRIFSLSDVCSQLEAASFSDIKVWREDYLPHGVYQKEPWARPISAVAC